MDYFFTATDNRLKCSLCPDRIRKGEGYFRSSKSGWRFSHVVNIHKRHFKFTDCKKCSNKLKCVSGLVGSNFCYIGKEKKCKH